MNTHHQCSGQYRDGQTTMYCNACGENKPSLEVRLVWMRKGMTFRGPPVPLCKSCRKSMKSDWKYAL